MSLHDRVTQSLSEDSDQSTPESLEEMFMSRPMRYLNPRDLQYSLEDAATACERNWEDRTRHRMSERDKSAKPAHDKLVKALRAAAAAAKDYADAQDKAIERI